MIVNQVKSKAFIETMNDVSSDKMLMETEIDNLNELNFEGIHQIDYTGSGNDGIFTKNARF